MSCIMDLLRRLPARLRANDPDPDSYETKVRVMALMCLCVLAVAPVVAAIYMSIDRPPSPLPAGYFFLQTGMVAWPTTWFIIVGWGIIVGKTLPVMMDALIGGSMLAAFFVATGGPQFDTTYISMLLFITTALTVGTTWWKLWYAVGHALAFVQGYNRFAAHAGWTLASVEPMAVQGLSNISYAVSTVGYLTGVVIMCAMLLLQRFEYLRAKSAAVAAEEVTATIAVKLQAYDTTAAAEALQHETAAGVDKELKAAFTALVANLESYRPYLPNWLLATTDEEVDDDGDGDGDEATDVDVLSGSQQSSSDLHPQKAPNVRAKKVSRSTIDYASVKSGSDRDNVGRRNSEHGRGSTSDESSFMTSHRTSLHAMEELNNKATAFEKRSYLKGTVTFAIVEYVTEDVPDAALSETLTAVADAVHRCAAECKGAVHTMLLGEIVVSWNVATRVAGPEAKAARFLLSLRTALANADDVHHGFKAVAAAASHHARSETIGTQNKLLTSERIGALRHQLRGVLRFAWIIQYRPKCCTTGTSSNGTLPHENTDNGHAQTTESTLVNEEPQMRQKLSVVLLDERTTREASSNFIISAGAVLDLASHMPVNEASAVQTLRLPQMERELESSHRLPLVSSPNTTTSPPFQSPTCQSPVDVLPSTLHAPLSKRRPSAPAKQLPGQLSETSSISAGRESSRNAEACALPRHAECHPHQHPARSVVHVFDLVSARKGGDDEWLYAMEEGAADAARAAQLMVGAGLRRQSGGVDAAAVRAAFEEAGKQRDGAAIMARPLVRQMVEGLHLLPVHV